MKNKNVKENPSKKTITKNIWIDKGKFSYKVFWPYCEELNPNSDTVDIYIKTSFGDFVTTFLTIQELQRYFERFKSNGEYNFGVYIPLVRKEILVESISNETIEKTLEDMVKIGDLEKCCDRIEKEASS